ncbi:MAG: EAL domain-containing protein [Oscillospiraceae bacterium]|nr:EAL domain-containing protein [Oscillospiraceae bacterium]
MKLKNMNNEDLSEAEELVEETAEEVSVEDTAAEETEPAVSEAPIEEAAPEAEETAKSEETAEEPAVEGAASDETEEAAVEEDAAEPEEPAEPETIEPSIFLNEVRHTVLVMEKDEMCLRVIIGVLSEEYTVKTVGGKDDIFAMLDADADDIALVIVDADSADGIEVVRVLKDEHGIQSLAMTSDPEKGVKAIEAGAMDFISKPLPAIPIIRTRVDRCAELTNSRSLIGATECDDNTALYNEDYFEHYVGMFDRHHPDVSMDAVIAVIGNLDLMRKHYGRKLADEVLHSAGRAVKRVLDSTGGYGCRSGDDLLIYMPHAESYNKLVDDISSQLEIDPSVAEKTRICLGVYSDVDKSISTERRFSRARIAVQSVLKTYTDRIGVYNSDMHDEALFKEQILGEFLSSLKNDRFKIYYQPKFDIRGDKPVLYSAEALVRWDHPQLGMLSPGRFIGLLEENGLITQLDRYVWSKAAAQIRRWKNEFGYSVPVSVNVSNIDMLLPLLKDIFKEILQKYQLSNDDIILEITQAAYDSDNANKIISAAQEMRGMGMGMRIEVGNVGAGFSSIGMLSRMPIDVLKIDMQFVHDSLGDNKDMSMIELIIDIADYLNVPVLAEGVETLDQYLLLKALGCDLVQGYYFSKPVPREEFDRFIKEAGFERAGFVQEGRKNYISISKALTGEYEGIFYIDVNTDHYLLFYSGSNGEFRIHTSGKDFFKDVDQIVPTFVVEEDRERIADLLAKNKLMQWIGSDEPFSTHFRRVDDGEGALCTLESIHTRNQDDHHIVLGIRPPTDSAK